MNVALVLVQEDGRQVEVPLKKAVQVIGRQTDVAVRIPSAAVSRHHCEVAVTDTGITVKDLGSSNGTFVNRKPTTQANLKAGDLLCVGDKVFVVRVDGQPVEIDAEEAFDDGFVPPTGAGGTAPAASASKPATPKPAAPGAQGGVKPAAQKPLVSADPGDSSFADFDFLDEDDDMKKQPKL